MGCYYHFWSCQETRPSLSEQNIERGNKKREMDELRREYIKEKGNILKKCGSVSGGSILKQILQSRIKSKQIFLIEDLCLLILYLKK